MHGTAKCRGVLLTLLALPSLDQAAEIRGTVSGPTRAVVAGARVTVCEEATGFARATATNPSGFFSFPDLDLGNYAIEVAFSGFKTTLVRVVDLVLERAGNFSGPTFEDCNPAPVDPLTGAPFPGNQIPADRLSPGGLLLLQLYALPNTIPSGGTCNNWVTSLASPTRWREDSLRVDWNVSQRSHVLVRYTQDFWDNRAPSDSQRLWGDP